MLKSSWFRWFRRRFGLKETPRRRSALVPALEVLEDRMVPSTIVWTNRLKPSDKFTRAERAVVDQAIATWEKLIVDFNHFPPTSPVEDELSITIRGGSRSGLNLGGTHLGITTGDSIRIDADAGGFGWFVDRTPKNRSEFTKTVTPNHFSGGPGREDLLSVVLHEIGHALGMGHVANNNDLMNPTTLSGHRYLPSRKDLTLLAQKSGFTVNVAGVTPKVFFLTAYLEVGGWDPFASESSPKPRIELALSTVPAQPVTMNLVIVGTATLGADYELTVTSVTFAAGEHRKTIPLTIIDDSEAENMETIGISLSAVVGAELWDGHSTYVYHILDND
jgi:Calx-beta domain/Matrixin